MIHPGGLLALVPALLPALLPALALALSCALSLPVQAATPSSAVDVLAPLPVRNDNPVLRLLGIPRSPGADLLAPGATALTLLATEVNNFSFANEQDERVDLDGETSVLELLWRRRLGNGLELSLAVPLVAHHGGGLDRVIDSFHETFGFGALDRDQVRRNRLFLRHSIAGQDQFRVDAARRGLGDVALRIAMPVLAMPAGGQLTAWAGVELPTGSAAQLTGSGSLDLSAGLSLASAAPHKRWQWGWYGSGGILLMTSASRVDNRHAAAFGHLGVALAVARDWQLLGQIDSNSRLLRSATSQLGDMVALVSVGLRWQATAGTRVSALLVEDLKGRSAPDVAVQLGVQHRW